MAIQVTLSEILVGLEAQSDLACSYLNTRTGEVVTVGSGLDWSEEAQEQVVQSGGEYLALPDRFELDEYSIMQAFAATSAQAERLGVALKGRGAFHRFKDLVHELGVAQDWYAYRDQALERIAREWCAAHGVELTND